MVADGVRGILICHLGLIPFGIATLRAAAPPQWSRPVPLLGALLGPLIMASRLPFSPLLGLGDPVGYLLLWSGPAVFGLVWVLLGYALWSEGKRP